MAFSITCLSLPYHIRIHGFEAVCLVFLDLASFPVSTFLWKVGEGEVVTPCFLGGLIKHICFILYHVRPPYLWLAVDNSRKTDLEIRPFPGKILKLKIFSLLEMVWHKCGSVTCFIPTEKMITE